MDLATGRITDAELLDLAKALAWTRPLARYPGWKFGSDWDRTELAFQLRKLVWLECQKRAIGAPVLLDWLHGLRVFVHLGNDLSLPLFVGGCIDPNELTFLAKVLVPGAVFVDAGANEGLYTLLASRLVGDHGRVVAVEPSSREFQRLQRAELAQSEHRRERGEREGEPVHDRALA